MANYPAIRKACLEITLDNGGLNRFRPERQVNKEMGQFLASRPYDEHLSAIDAWLAGLNEPTSKRSAAANRRKWKLFWLLRRRSPQPCSTNISTRFADMDGKKKLEELVARRAELPGWFEVFVPIADLRSISDAYKAMEAENERLRTTMRKMAEGWSNALELDLVPPQHRTSAQILRDEAHDVLKGPAMTDDLIERCARAMVSAWCYAPEGSPDWTAEWWRRQDQYRKQARAVLAIARPAILEEAAKAIQCDCCDVCGESPDYQDVCANELAARIRALATTGER